MHPTTAKYLIESRQSDLYAEAARERLASEVRAAARRERTAPAKAQPPAGIVAATRRLVLSLLALA
jgi:hypothetical protein